MMPISPVEIVEQQHGMVGLAFCGVAVETLALAAVVRWAAAAAGVGPLRQLLVAVPVERGSWE